GDESVANVFPRKGMAPDEGRSPPQRKITRGAPAGLNAIPRSPPPPLRAHHPPRLLRADAIERGLWPIHGDVHGRIGHRVIRVPVRISALEQMRHDVAMLATEELSSLVVEAHAVLAFARLDGQRHRPRIE